jgi:hypothetical protein
VALRWLEDADELWLSDDGRAVRGLAQPMVFLWRREGGMAALERFRIERAELGRPPWLLIDRDRRQLFLGSGAAVWRVVEGPEQRR